MAASKTRLFWQLWKMSCHSKARSFQADLAHPEQQQAAYLKSILAGAAGTAWAREYKVGPDDDIASYQDRVPIMDAGALGSWTDRIRNGEQKVLTNTEVYRLVPTSGTTGASKLIPMTRASQREFALAVDLWIYDLLERYPEVRNGRCYIATSPAQNFVGPASKVPVGFADDRDYLSRMGRIALWQNSVLPKGIARLRGDDWKQQTQAALMAARDLSLISIWHPSYWFALFDHAELQGALESWPKLRVLSSWSDGACRTAADSLMSHLPGVALQAKGLWLTEGVVSIPWQDRHPLALQSGFFEFEDDAGTIRLAHELEEGLTYRPVISNHAGLYRYRLGDLIRVETYVGKTPGIRWIGRADSVSDLCGEKLSEAQIEQALASIGWHHYAQLEAADATSPPHYNCLLEEDRANAFPLQAFEQALAANPHYKWCRSIGQLGPISIQAVHTTDIPYISTHAEGHGNYHFKGRIKKKDWTK